MFNGVRSVTPIDKPFSFGENLGLKDLTNYTRPIRIAYPDGVGTWELMDDSSKFGLLEEASYCCFKGNLLALGGKISGELQNRVFYSSDFGKSWQSKKAGFPERSGAAVVEFRGFLYLLGGETSKGLTNEIWRSADGEHWLPVSSSSPFTSRKNFTAVRFQNFLLLTGGQGPEAKEIWKSFDGINWEIIHADAFFGQLESPAIVEHHASLFLVGGKSGMVLSNSVYKSENGVDWALVTNTAFPSGKFGVGLVVMSGQMVAIGGNDGSPLNSVYTSYNGLTWTEDVSPQPFEPRYQFGCCLLDGYLVVFGAANDSYRKVVSYEMYLNDTLIPFGADFVLWDETYHELLIKKESQYILTRFCTLIGGIWNEVSDVLLPNLTVGGDYTERYYPGVEMLLYNTKTKEELFTVVVNSSFDGTETLIEVETTSTFIPDYICPYSDLTSYLNLKFKPEVKFIPKSVEDFMGKASLKPQGGVIESGGGVDILSDRVFVAKFISQDREVDSAFVLPGDYKTKLHPMFRIIVTDEFNKVLLDDRISFDFN